MNERMKQLEVALKRTTQERDDLARDVESLCLQGDSYFSFSSSSVLGERISLTEKQLSMTQSQVYLSTGLQRWTMTEATSHPMHLNADWVFFCQYVLDSDAPHQLRLVMQT